jgi:hypothetical protein
MVTTIKMVAAACGLSVATFASASAQIGVPYMPWSETSPTAHEEQDRSANSGHSLAVHPSDFMANVHRHTGHVRQIN